MTRQRKHRDVISLDDRFAKSIAFDGCCDAIPDVLPR